MKNTLESSAVADVVTVQVKELYTALETLGLRQRQWNTLMQYGSLSPAAAVERYRQTMDSLVRQLPQIVPKAISQLPTELPDVPGADQLSLPDAILE